MKTTILNIFAGPSCGKTTLAAKLFYELKISNIFKSVELVQEYAKQLVWQERFEELKHQPTVTKGQINLLMPLVSKVEFIITDSPIELGLAYSSKEHFNEVKAMIEECNKHYNTINLFLDRGEFKFEEIGRIHNQVQSIQKDNEIKYLLDTLNVKYEIINHNTSIIDIVKLFKAY